MSVTPLSHLCPPSHWPHCAIPIPMTVTPLCHPHSHVTDPSIPSLSPHRCPAIPSLPHGTDPCHCAIPVPTLLTPHYPLPVPPSLPPLCHAPGADAAVPPADAGDEGWCRKHGVCAEALRLAGTVRAELLEVMRRIELPVSPPAFGSDANALNIQRALISGYFLKVGPGGCGELWGSCGGCANRPTPSWSLPGRPRYRRLRQLRDADAQARGPPGPRLRVPAAATPAPPAPLGALP